MKLLAESIRPILQKKSRIIHSVAPTDSVQKALALMAEKGIGALLVLQDGKLMGIISERDYARKVFLKGRSSPETTVAEIMSAPVLTVSPDHSVGDCMHIMTENRIRHLPVFESEQLTGIISIAGLPT
jgi:CBS domain-containing protein